MITLGIDSGVTGAIAAADGHGSYQVQDFDTEFIAGDRKVKRRLNGALFRKQIRSIVPPGVKALAVIEELHMRPGNGGAATFSLGYSTGLAKGILEAEGITVVEVQPITWKGFYGLLGKEKRASIETAIKLCPGLAHLLQRQMDHNRAESLLLAHYGQRKLT